MTPWSRLVPWVLPLLLIASTAPAQAPTQARPGPEAILDPPWFRESLERVRQRHKLPALAAAVVVGNRVVIASAVGVRKVGSDAAVTRDDPFHLGSIAKVLTATMIGRLVDRGSLRWDATMAELFPELRATMQPEYQGVTLLQQLSHTSGMPYEPLTPELQTDGRGRTLQARRLEYVKAAVLDPPEAPPGTRVIYSGGGIIAASAAERATHEGYETLMSDLIFRPLRMTHSGFGRTARGGPGVIDGPWEHEVVADQVIAVALPPSYDHETRAPVGRNAHASVIDLARFAALHLRGAHGGDPLLKPETFKILQTPIATFTYGPGWNTAETHWAKGRVLWHSGSNGRNTALLHVVPEEDYATVVMTNVGGASSHGRALDEVNLALVTRIRRQDLTAEGRATLPGAGPVPPRPDVPLEGLTPRVATTGFGRVRTDANAAGAPLRLDGVPYAQGVGVHAESALVYDRQPDYRRFVGRVGIDDQQVGHGTIVVKVVAGSTLLHESPVLRGGDPPWNLDVALPAAAGGPIRLVVEGTGDGISWDLTDWVDAGFLKGQ